MAVSAIPDLGTQTIGDFFKSASRNMAITLWLVRIIAISMLYLLVLAITQVMKEEVLELSNFSTLINFVMLFFFVIFIAILSGTSYITALLAGTAADEYAQSIRAFARESLFGDISLMEGFDAEIFYGSGGDPFAPLAYLINYPQKVIYNPILVKGLILTGIAIIVISGIGFIRKSDVKLSGLTLVTAQLTIGLAYLKDFTKPLLLDNTTITTLLTSSLFQLALISYLYFEFSLQTGYLHELTSPTLTRQKRVGKQLEMLSEFRLGITKLGTDEEKESAEAKKKLMKEDDEENEEGKESTSLAVGTGSTTSRKYSSDALLFLLDSASDSLFSKPGGEQERLTGRLQRYHDGLLAHDPKLDDKLGGSAEKAFNPFSVLISVIVSLSFRLVVIIFLSWLVVKPNVLLEFIALPESITNSLEINQPEGLLIILIPVVFLIVGISYLFAQFQSYIVKSEELIIEEADIGRLLQAGKVITSREEGMKEIEKIIEKEQKEQEEAEKDFMGLEDQINQPRKRKRKRKAATKKDEDKK